MSRRRIVIDPSNGSIAVTCFSHLGITVANLAASVAFYAQVLGFSVKYENVEQDWTRVGLALGDIIIELFSTRESGHSEHDFDSFYPMAFGRPKLALTVRDAVLAYDQLLMAGINPRCPVTKTRASKFFFIEDPDGTPIQLQEFVGGRERLAELFTAEPSA